MLAIDPALFADVHGSTDTEVVFHLALTFGLEEDPIAALERTVGLIEATAAAARGRRPGAGRASASRTAPSLWAVRYATEGPPAIAVRVGRRGLGAPPASRQRRASSSSSQDDRVIVSEPFADLPGVWHEIPQSTAVTVRRGGVLEHRPFQPQPPARSVAASMPDA